MKTLKKLAFSGTAAMLLLTVFASSGWAAVHAICLSCPGGPCPLC